MNSEVFSSLFVSHCYTEILLYLLIKSPFNIIKFQTGKKLLSICSFKVRKICF